MLLNNLHINLSIPYGKVIREYVGGDKERYLTTQHERDAETGLDYRGARYYDSDVARFLSLDPLANKLMNFSPYNYCVGNPTGYLDEDGKYPTPWEAALLSKAVYGDDMKNFDLNGWKVSKAVNHRSNILLQIEGTGFKSQLFERTVDGKTEYVYAFAGTEDAKDVQADINQTGGKSLQYSRAVMNAKRIVQELGDAEITFVGHSLGGGLAKAAALSTEGSAITFNPAWLSPATMANEGLFNKKADITNYYVNGEVLNTGQSILSNTQIGKATLTQNGTYKKISNWGYSLLMYNFLEKHSINTVIQYMETDASYDKD